MAEEIESTDAPETPTAEGVSDEESTIDFEARAAEVEAELEAEEKQETKEDKEETPAKRSGALQRIIDEMYGGNEDAFYNGFRERDNQMSKLSKRVEELQSALSKSKESDEEEDKKAALEHPDVKWIDEEMQSLAGEHQGMTSRQGELVKEYNELLAKYNKLEGKHEAADDLDKVQIKAEMAEARTTLKAVTSEYNENVRRLNSYARQYKDLQRRKDIAEKEALAERRQSKVRESEAQEIQRASGEQFTSSMQSEATKFGIDVGSPLYRQVFHSVKNQLLDYMSNLPEGSPGIDIPAAVQELMKDAANALNLSPRKQFSNMSKEKAQVVTKPTKPVSPVVRNTPTSTTQKWTAEFVRKRAERILG